MRFGLRFCFRVTDVFNVIDQKDEEVEFYRKKFAGSQADRILRAEAEAEKVAEQLKKTKVSGRPPPPVSLLSSPILVVEEF